MTVTTPLPLIPAPEKLTRTEGAFRLDAGTRLLVAGPEDPDTDALVEWWADSARTRWRLPLPVQRAAADPGPAPGNTIVLRLDRPEGVESTPSDSRLLDEPGGRDESYRLRVEEDGVEVKARDAAGLFYGLRTLEQLVAAGHRSDRAGSGDGGDAEAEAAGAPPHHVPAVLIEDGPRFPYRGLHLDVGRHLFPVEFVKRYVDLLSRFKLNVFHWHLTEDQGWRLEIEGYPRLTEVGAFRAETQVGKNSDPYVGDGTPYGGFYTREEVREVVAYARERFVTVIPEIEMPGHSLAALASYPELACTPGPFEVGTRWGVFQDIYCPGEETFAFLEDVLAETMELFPSRYIHIGGDEAPKTRWEESPLAQDVMAREGLEDEAELQSWFIRRIQRYLDDHGRRIIGWDEILEGGLAPGATVMSWRGTEGGIEAARQGHDVIMTPTSHLYFDYYQADPGSEPLAIGGHITLEDVFRFEPVPPELTPAQARHVLGAQANVWTEYMKTPEKVEYMAYPRVLALAERVWSPRDRGTWAGFRWRVEGVLRMLDEAGVNYRPLGGRGGGGPAGANPGALDPPAGPSPRSPDPEPGPGPPP